MMNTLTQLLKGDRRLKRLAVSIVTKHQPDQVLSGYALVTELNDKVLSFFSTQKFGIDEILTVRMMVDADAMEFKLRMSHLHEQISSGRIMNAIPTEENPFPARKFYRCFAEVIGLKQNGVSLLGDEPASETSDSHEVSNVSELKPAENSTPAAPDTAIGEQKAA